MNLNDIIVVEFKNSADTLLAAFKIMTKIFVCRVHVTGIIGEKSAFRYLGMELNL
jgi:hypothetical protein